VDSYSNGDMAASAFVDRSTLSATSSTDAHDSYFLKTIQLDWAPKDDTGPALTVLGLDDRRPFKGQQYGAPIFQTFQDLHWAVQPLSIGRARIRDNHELWCSVRVRQPSRYERITMIELR